MAPKRKAPGGSGDAAWVVRLQMLFFGESPVSGGTLRRMGESRLIDAAKAEPPKDEETRPNLSKSQVVVFQDQFSAGLRFPLDPVVVGILGHLKIFLHQLTPNAFVRLALYMWICWTTKVNPSLERVCLRAPCTQTAAYRHRRVQELRGGD